MPEYVIVFPRWTDDIVSKRRTLVHLPVIYDGEYRKGPRFRVGQTLMLTPLRQLWDCWAEITSVDRVQLLDSLAAGDEDWILLNLAPIGVAMEFPDRERARANYWKRWDSTNPTLPCSGNPMVWRVVFKYLPERPERDRDWCIAG